jgi:hypothetical protein
MRDNEQHKSIAAIIRDVLKSSHRAMSIDELAAASDGLTAKQVRAACFEMAKRGAVVKCGTGGRQLFKLGTVKPKPTFNVPIAPPESVPVVRVSRSVETIEEWMQRTGRTVQRLPMGATAFPLRRIAA